MGNPGPLLDREETAPRGERWERVLASGALVGFGAFAYRGLTTYDPYAVVRIETSGADTLFFSPATSDPLLVLALLGAVVLRRIGSVRRGVARPAGAAWVIPLALGAATALAAYAASAPWLLGPSLALVVPAGGALLGGRRFGWSLLPAGLLALFVAPLPPLLVNQMIYPLQLATSTSSGMILSVLGFDPFVSAERIGVGSDFFDVIETCSGYRTIAILTMVSVFYVGMFDRGVWHSGLLVVSAPLIAFVFNAFRVVSLIMNPASKLQDVHTAQGLVLVALGAIALTLVDRALLRVLPRRQDVASDPPREAVESRGARVEWRWSVAGAVAVLLAVGSVALPKPGSAVPPMYRLYELPNILGAWEGDGLPLERRFFGTTRFSEWVHRRYHKADGLPVDLLLVSDKRLHPHTILVSPKLALPGSGWQVASRSRARLEVSGRELEVLEVAYGERRSRVFLWSYGMADPEAEIARALLGAGIQAAGMEPLVVARLVTPLTPDWRGRVEADRRLRELARLVDGTLEGLRGRGVPTAGSRRKGIERGDAG